MAVELVYETHSTSVDNERGTATGWLDGELSARGREQAAELGRRRRDDRVSMVYVSDLGRAVETAEIAFAGTDIPVRQDPRLRECDYGELNGAPVGEVAAVRRLHVEEAFPGGESYRQVLVYHDLLGLTEGHLPRFVKRYANLSREIRDALEAYAADVRSGAFPGEEHTYSMSEAELEAFTT